MGSAFWDCVELLPFVSTSAEFEPEKSEECGDWDEDDDCGDVELVGALVDGKFAFCAIDG